MADCSSRMFEWWWDARDVVRDVDCRRVGYSRCGGLLSRLFRMLADAGCRSSEGDHLALNPIT